MMTKADHERAVEEGTEIVEEVNAIVDEVNGHKPFVVVGDVNSSGVNYKSFWFKTQCRPCGELFELCPAKKNLWSNLENHLQGLKHGRILLQSSVSSRSSSTALSTGRLGRPTKSSSLTSNQQQLHGYFKRTCSDGGDGEFNLPLLLVFSLLCWGYWGIECKYAAKSYYVKGLLQDPNLGASWIPKPSTVGEVDYNSASIIVEDNFRHKECMRVLTLGTPFPELTCSLCAQIPQEKDFRNRIYAMLDEVLICTPMYLFPCYPNCLCLLRVVSLNVPCLVGE
jgi:hypothetical protein